jgi:hypothetical protein
MWKINATIKRRIIYFCAPLTNIVEQEVKVRLDRL